MSGYIKTGTCENDEENGKKLEWRVYRRRWGMLMLFCMYCIVSVMQWPQYSIIADVVVKYYGISYEAVDWNSMVYLLLYIPFSMIGTFILDKMGLRVAVLLGSVGTSIGAWIKVASVAPDRYWVLILGQSVVAVSEVLMLPLPSRLAAAWFGQNEVASACSVAVSGIQLGIAVGFVVPPLIVTGEDDVDKNLTQMTVGTAAICSFVTLALLLVFQEKPPYPPSQLQIEREEFSFRTSLKNVTCNRNFIFLTIACSIITGVNYAVSILLNQIILAYHPDAAQHAGIIGLLLIMAGIVGCIVPGMVLDKYHKYRETTLAVYGTGVLAMIAFLFAVKRPIEFIYLAVIALGFSVVGFLSLALDLAARFTYPISEGISGGLVVVMAQFTGIAFTYLYSNLFYVYGDVWANFAMLVMLLFGFYMLFFIQFKK